MGSGESTPRRVTVENEDEDTIGVVKISESLFNHQQDPDKPTENPSSDDVKKLWQDLLDQKRDLDYQQEKIDDLLLDAFEQGRNIETESRNGSSVLVEENLRKTLHDKEQEIMELRKKKQLIEEEQMKKSAEIEKATSKEFSDAIQFMQQRYSNRKVAPVCSSLQHRVLDCYKENKNKSLKCSHLVHAYVSCIEQARKALNEKK